MIYYLVTQILKTGDKFGFLRVLTYITVRSILAFGSALLISILAGPYVINKLSELKIGQSIRKITKEGSPDLFAIHKGKSGTPTMGGLLIIVSFLIPVLLLCNLKTGKIQLLIVLTILLGLIGFGDDYKKLIRKDARGLSPKYKIIGQLLVGFLLGLYIYVSNLPVNYYYKGVTGYTYLLVPFFKDVYPNLGIFFILFAMLVIVASSNAVNLTDGLDGLAIGVTIITILPYIIISYLVGRIDFAKYLIVPYIPNSGEITIFLSAMSGAGLGFLWFNSHPAQIFMGDTGSLTIGGLLGTVAILLKQELLLIFIGGIFVIEALSVIIQVLSYKITGKRVFRMSPLHHHYEMGGMAESKIIMRFYIVSVLLALFGLSLLKLR